MFTTQPTKANTRMVFCMKINSLLLMCLLVMNISYAQSTASYGLYPLIEEIPNPMAIKSDQEGRLWITRKTGELVITSRLDLYQAEQALTQQTIDLDLADLYVAGQGGLIDVLLLDSSDAETKQLMVSYAKGNEAANATAVSLLELSWNKAENSWQLNDSRVVFINAPTKSSPVHYGGRLVQLGDGTILLTTGDGFDWREAAQDTSSGLGKVMRFNVDGSPASDNPFIDSTHPIKRYVYSFGHRNPQGLVIGQGGQIWEHEHGPAGGDEINLITAGTNYGWPVVTQGKDYSGALITPFDTYPEMQLPQVNWTPSIAPSGMYFYEHTLFSEFTNTLLVTSLVAKTIHVTSLNDLSNVDTVDLDTQVFRIQQNDVIQLEVPRLRDITALPTGEIFVISDGDNGEVLQLKKLRLQQ